MKRIAILTVVLFAAFKVVIAQNEDFKPSVNFKGFTQMYFSYTDGGLDENSPYGFTLRRVRFVPYGKISPKISWKLHLAYDKQVARMLDVALKYKHSKAFAITAGQFAPPAAKSGIVADELFSTTNMIMVERPTITQYWQELAGFYAYRAVGVKFDGLLLSDKLYYGVMVANAKAGDLFSPGLKTFLNNHDYNGLAFYGRLEFKPVNGIGFGGFFTSSNAQRPASVDVNRSSYGGHLFVRKNNASLLTEYIGGQVDIDGVGVDYSGVFTDVAYRFDKIEPALRYSIFTPNGGDADENWVKKRSDFALGLNYYFRKDVKIQANYVIRGEEMIDGFNEVDNNIFYIHFQYMFNSK